MEPMDAYNNRIRNLHGMSLMILLSQCTEHYRKLCDYNGIRPWSDDYFVSYIYVTVVFPGRMRLLQMSMRRDGERAQ